MRIWEFQALHPRLAQALAVILATSMLLVLFTPPAYAGLVEGIFVDGAQGLLDAASGFISGIQTGDLTATFTTLFGNAQVYNVVVAIHNTVISAVAYSILAIVYLVQLVRIANKLDGNAAVPGLKEVIFLMIFFVIGKFVIDNSMLFCEALYNGFNELTILIQQNAGAQATQIFTVDPSANDDMAQAASAFFLAIIIWIASLAASVITYVVVLARSLQVYIYAMFAAIPLAMLGAEETKQYGMGFIKNFIALCITGCIIAATLIIWSLAMQTAGGGAIGAANADVIKSLALCILLCVCMAKSGGWARDIIGG